MKKRMVHRMISLMLSIVTVAGMVFAAVPFHAHAATTTCTYCDGLGDCGSCLGLGDCDVCYGLGDDICGSCSFGRCLNCGGEGVIKNYVSGKIKEKKCTSCSGTGDCKRCDGHGNVTCYSCKGSGDCSSCKGSQKCTYCNGSGKVKSSGNKVISSIFGRNKNTENQEPATKPQATQPATKPQATQPETTPAIPEEQHISIDQNTLTLKVGQSHTFIVNATTRDGKVSVDYDTQFLEQDKADSFTFTARKTGSTAITFRSTDGKEKEVCHVTVVEDPTATDNILTVTIDGKKETFYQDDVILTDTEISVYYYSYNPRGEQRYYISFSFDKNLTVGTYQTTESILYSDVNITFAEAGANQFFRSYRKRGNNGVTGSFTIESVSSDWNTYTGSFAADLVLYGKNQELKITDAEFVFAISENPENEAAAAVVPGTPNTLTATINGESVVFYLVSAKLAGSEIAVNYYALNPRGEARYLMAFSFDKNLDEGTYNTTESILYSDVTITFAEANANEYYRSYRKHGNNAATGSFTIETMSDDWNTYTGSFAVDLVLYGKQDTIKIDDAEFDFTLGEVYSAGK